MSKPVVAIVGRPNVGKSTLFNVLAGEKISIVKDTPGVTRDRIYADTSWLDKEFTLIDTGGIEPESKDVILSQMREQAQIAIDTADVIVFITDVRQGLVDADSKVADMLRRSGKPVVLVVNKVDSFEKFMPDVYEFYNLGIGDPHPVSAASRLGIGDMLDAVSYTHLLQVKLSEKDSKKIVLDKKKKYTVEDFFKDLEVGKGYTIKTKADPAVEGSYKTEVVFDKNIQKKLDNEWKRKVKLTLKPGKIVVKNPIGEWEGEKFKRYDGSYVTEDFVVSKGKTYYFDADGNMATGIHKIGGGTYAFDEKGVMKTGWQKDESGKYYICLLYTSRCV